MAEMDKDLRHSVGIQPAEKYRSIKSKQWKADVARFFTVAYMAMEAYEKPTAAASSGSQ